MATAAGSLNCSSVTTLRLARCCGASRYVVWLDHQLSKPVIAGCRSGQCWQWTGIAFNPVLVGNSWPCFWLSVFRQTPPCAYSMPRWTSVRMLPNCWFSAPPMQHNHLIWRCKPVCDQSLHADPLQRCFHLHNAEAQESGPRNIRPFVFGVLATKWQRLCYSPSWSEQALFRLFVMIHGEPARISSSVAWSLLLQLIFTEQHDVAVLHALQLTWSVVFGLLPSYHQWEYGGMRIDVTFSTIAMSWFHLQHRRFIIFAEPNWYKNRRNSFLETIWPTLLSRLLVYLSLFDFLFAPHNLLNCLVSQISTTTYFRSGWWFSAWARSFTRLQSAPRGNAAWIDLVSVAAIAGSKCYF